MSRQDITKIPIKSAVKIFTFLDQFLEVENLNPEYLQTHLEIFSFEERYFLGKYALEYYSLENDTYLDKWLRNKVSLLGGYNECQSFINEIINNVKEVKKIFNFKNRGVIEKNFKTSEIIKQTDVVYIPTQGIKQEIKIITTEDFTNIKPRKRLALKRKYRVYERIPLCCIEKELFDKFKIQFFDALKTCLDYNSAEKLFFNTFEFQGNSHHLQFLNLKVGKKAQLEIAIGILSRSYKEAVLDHLKLDSYKKYNSSIDEKLKSASKLKRKFIPKKLGKPVEIQRIHFMRAMYNGFTYLREAYQKDLSKNSALDLDTFLKKKLKNIPSA